MILDTSAIVTILLKEEHWQVYLEAIVSAPVRLMSAVTLYEVAVVMYRKRRRKADLADLCALLSDLKVEIVPFGYDDAILSASAYQKYGKGQHPAALNLGDCPPFSLSFIRQMPLLYKGDDFSSTPVQSAL